LSKIKISKFDSKTTFHQYYILFSYQYIHTTYLITFRLLYLYTIFIMNNINEKLDLYYNPWTDLSFDQNNQSPIPDTLPAEEELPTEQEALQFALTQSYNNEDMDSNQDPWETYEEIEIASGFAIGYNHDERSDIWSLADKTTINSTISKSKRSLYYTFDDLIHKRLKQIKKLLELRINSNRLKKILYILTDIQFFLYPNLPTSVKELNRDFGKLMKAKSKAAQSRLTKQVLRKIDKCKTIHIKGFILADYI